MPTYKKVIFLDIDGVLILIGKNSIIKDFIKMIFYKILSFLNILYKKRSLNRGCVKRLKKIVEKHKAVIILSATMRVLDNWEERIFQDFKKAGWKNPPIIGRTPNMGNKRGKEIKAWLDKNTVESFIIIEDEEELLEEQLPFTIRTHGFTGGFKKEHTNQIEEIWK
jgi:hypothetical protein